MAPVQVDGLFLMMGQGLERLRSVPAGCVLALGGLDRTILKSATLSSSPACRPLAPMLFQVPLTLTLALVFCPATSSILEIDVGKVASSVAVIVKVFSES